jgi:para-aminobenzoate synthetase component 1
VKRIYDSFLVSDFASVKLKMLNWAKKFNIFCFLDNQLYQSQYSSQECLLAVGALDFLSAHAGRAFDKLSSFSQKHNDWLFGHFGYDLKNELENLSSGNPDYVGFSDLYFFVPEILIELRKDKIRIGIFGDCHLDILRQINDIHLPDHSYNDLKNISVQSRFTMEEYLERVDLLKKHIARGDCYEINFCQEFFLENFEVDVVRTYCLLTEVSPNPFSALYRINDKYLICASPERYLRRDGKRILSQPIKGTWEKNPFDVIEDNRNKDKLLNSAKDRSENVMIVDLVRNDFSKICDEGSVSVDELYGIYSFPQLHHMISSISGKLRSQDNWTDIIKATFPMGSMTGAPKKKVMELIERYERTKRGIFSGALGYLDPANNFDFNVVIRSILYNQTNKYLSFPVGSGITFYSDAKNEYDECMLKLSSIKKVLTL